MNFGRFDMVLIFSMAIAIILMSFIMPAAGVTTANNTSSSDIPEFNISASNWDIVGDFPDNPNTPQTGQIERFENQTIIGEHIAWIELPKSDGYSVELTNFSGDMEININRWSGGSSVEQYRYNITGEDQTIRHNDGNYSFEFDVVHYANHAQPNMSAVVDWRITAAPGGDEGGLLESIPIIGGLFDAGEQLVAMLGYLASIIYWAVGTVFETSLAVVGVVLSVVTYGIDTMVWLSTTYTSMVDAAPGWAAIIVLIPGIIISVEFVKIAMVAVRLLPTT